MRRALIGGVVLAGALVAGMPAAQAKSPRPQGRIAFERIDPHTGGSAILTIAPDGSGRRFVVQRGGAEQPAWSPDGRWIAFDAVRRGHPHLFVVRADGSGLRQLTFGHGDQGFPAWNPRGTRLVFDGNWPDRSRRGFHGGLGILSLQTGAVREITRRTGCDCPDAAPSWSPDGRLIAFVRVRSFDRGLTALATVHPDGSGVHRLTSFARNAANPDWSPDGRWIAFNTNDDRFDSRTIGPDIVRIRASGGRLHFVTRDEPARDASFQPSWSPDGRWIVYTNFHVGDAGTTLRIARASGAQQHPLVTGTTVPLAPDWGP